MPLLTFDAAPGTDIMFGFLFNLDFGFMLAEIGAGLASKFGHLFVLVYQRWNPRVRYLGLFLH